MSTFDIAPIPYSPAVRRGIDAVGRLPGATYLNSARATVHALGAALDVPQMASAVVDHLNTDTLPGDSETLVCAGCGHVLVTGDPDDDRDPQAEHATHHATLIRAHLLGGAS